MFTTRLEIHHVPCLLFKSCCESDVLREREKSGLWCAKHTQANVPHDVRFLVNDFACMPVTLPVTYEP